MSMAIVVEIERKREVGLIHKLVRRCGYDCLFTMRISVGLAPVEV